MTKHLNLTPCFSYNHYYTDGKLENLYEALDQANAESVCLLLTHSALDAAGLSPQAASERLARAKAVIKKLKHRGYFTHVVLPGPPESFLIRPGSKDIETCCQAAAAVCPHMLWFDAPLTTAQSKHDPQALIQAYHHAVHAVRRHNAKLYLGLILPRCGDALCGVLDLQAAEAAFSPQLPILAQRQPFTTDTNRLEILDVAHTLGVWTAQHPELLDRKAKSRLPAVFSYITNQSASSFGKSAEATQIQTNLSILFGIENIFYDLFDPTGTAPGAENPFLTIQNHRAKFLTTLLKKAPSEPAPLAAVQVVIPDDSRGGRRIGAAWPQWFWRMGFPVGYVRANRIAAKDTIPPVGVFLLTGPAAASLDDRQLEYLFHQGVILDPLAAKDIQARRPDLLGCQVGGKITQAYAEVFSNSAFGAPYYAYSAPLTVGVQPREVYTLTPKDPDAKAITTFAVAGEIQNKAASVCFDNNQRNQRSVVLPFVLDNAIPETLLSPARHRLMLDVCRWVCREPLPLVIENTPDLIPFVIHDPRHRRSILALLNISFDWAINARIRLSPKMNITDVWELDEQGSLSPKPELGPKSLNAYHYLQLSPETAVPPMQMTVLILNHR